MKNYKSFTALFAVAIVLAIMAYNKANPPLHKGVSVNFDIKDDVTKTQPDRAPASTARTH